MKWHKCVKFSSKTGKTVKEAKHSFSQWWSRSSPKTENNVTEEQLECVYSTHSVKVWCLWVQTVNQQFYLTFLWLLQEAVGKKWPELGGNTADCFTTALLPCMWHCLSRSFCDLWPWSFSRRYFPVPKHER